MICPNCTDAKLDAVVRDGVEIDVCPRCHGMWLDHGELTRLRTADPVSTAAAPIPADRYDPDAFGDEGWDGAGTEAHTRSKDRKPKDERPEEKPSKGRKQKRRGKKSKKRKRPSWSRRLGEIIEDVIDELD